MFGSFGRLRHTAGFIRRARPSRCHRVDNGVFARFGVGTSRRTYQRN
ncbi:hypothetical protein NSERUTF1_5583 [Nocardia seriolae]|nr:hypothetical protein NSERUTF1_5583 [Nocardia seriolae]